MVNLLLLLMFSPGDYRQPLFHHLSPIPPEISRCSPLHGTSLTVLGLTRTKTLAIGSVGYGIPTYFIMIPYTARHMQYL